MSTSTARVRRTLAIAVATLVTLELTASVAMRSLPADPYFHQDVADVKATLLCSGDPDLVVVGSSVADAAVDAHVVEEATGWTTVNAAVSAMKIVDVEWWLRHVVLRVSDPAAIVVFLNPLSVNDGAGTARHAELLASVGGQRAVGGMHEAEWLTARLFHASPLLSRRARLRTPMPTWRALRGDPPIAWVAPTDDWGSRVDVPEDSYPFPSRPSRPPMRGPFSQFHVGDTSRSALTRVLDTGQMGVDRVFVVLAPAMVEETAPLIDGGRQEFDAARGQIRALAATGGATLIDLTRFDDDPSLFYDEFHTNASGRRAVTAALAQRLAEELDGSEPANPAGTTGDRSLCDDLSKWRPGAGPAGITTARSE